MIHHPIQVAGDAAQQAAQQAHAVGSEALVFGTSLWMALEALWRLGPSWPVVPPLILSVASLVGVVDRYKANRHDEARAPRGR